MNKMISKGITFTAAMVLTVSAYAQVAYDEDFESLDPTAPAALTDSGWLIFANVFSDYPACTSFVYNYGPFPAPNGGPGFSSVVAASSTGQALNVYSDYNNQDHNAGSCIEASVFQELTATAADAGDYEFTFLTEAPAPPDDVLGPGVNTYGFIKLLDPNNNFNADIFLTVDTSTPGAKRIPFTLDASADGKILQWGFTSTASNFETTGRWYDNLVVEIEATEPPIQPPVPDDGLTGIPTLDQWGLLLMLVLVGGFGLFSVSRRS